MTDLRTLEHYKSHAHELAAAYNAAHGGISNYFPLVFPPSQTILDIGCGSGRDLARLAEIGHQVYGVDPSLEMLKEAKASFPALAEKLFHGALPDLDVFGDEMFNGIISSAVMMHIPKFQLKESVLEIRRILKTGGVLLISLPILYEQEGHLRDADGRLFNGLKPDELQNIMDLSGFMQIFRWESRDGLDRTDRYWVTALYRLIARHQA